MNNLFLNRRSVRKFKDRPIEKEKLNRILEISLTAPSGRNKKPWELIVVENKKTLKKLTNARPETTSFLEKASLGITVIADTHVSGTAIEDASIVAAFVQLAAEEEGLKSCWGHALNKVNLKGEDVEENIRNILNIPKEKRVLCTIGIGYGDEDKKPHNIENLQFDKVHFEKY